MFLFYKAIGILMKICEIFYSIQGEGTLMGMPTIFLRLSGCNLRCTYCDTTYAYESGEELTIEQVYEKIQQYSCKQICITGGEPLLQSEIYKLIDLLVKNNYAVSIETNGSQDISKLCNYDAILISMDIKCPSSLMTEKMNWKNLEKLTKKDQVKFIIRDKNDFDFSKKISNKYQIESTIYFQPVWNQLNLHDLAEWILHDNLDVTLGVQLHKFIYGNRRAT